MTTALDWVGAIGDVWAAEWRRTDRSFADLSRQLDAAVLAVAPAGRFRALDIGCGAGGTTLALAAARPEAAITGIDLSAGLVAVARDRATSQPAPTHGGEAGGGGVTFLVDDVVDAAPGLAPLDLLFSRHGVMFFDDPVSAFSAFHAAARPGATLVFSCFADWTDNAFARALADAIGAPPPAARAPGPFAFADSDHVAGILAAAGWQAAAATSASFAYRAGEGGGDAAVADALGFFQRVGPTASALRAAPPAERGRLLDRVAAVIGGYRAGDAIDFPARAWIWSARA